MKTERPPTIDPVAAARWAARTPGATPWLHEEVGRRMQERLQWMAKAPEQWVDWNPLNGGLEAHAAVQARYPRSACYVVEQTPAQVAQAQAQLARPWWQPGRWTGPQIAFETPTRSAGMLWANMCLHSHPDPMTLMQQWHACLATDGFLMFSCLGPDTLQQLRAVYAANGWPAPCHQFTDMHDWGDMLVQAGIAEPVMDMAHITLTYSSPTALLRELRELGRNLHRQRFGGLRGRKWRETLERALQEGLTSPQSDGRLSVTFEIIYGHAFKPVPRLPVASESVIQLEAMREVLGRPRPPGPGSR